jgi:hypothetical protein
VASDNFASVDLASLGGVFYRQDSRAGTTTTMKTALPGRFVSICSSLVGNIGEAYTVTADPFGGVFVVCCNECCHQVSHLSYRAHSRSSFNLSYLSLCFGVPCREDGRTVLLKAYPAAT